MVPALLIHVHLHLSDGDQSEQKRQYNGLSVSDFPIGFNLLFAELKLFDSLGVQ